ncbi:hypothetical protein GM3709_1349 [Geminocystis sp. NIES-3709]|nr:hypothetical protein GM3709_1349 [Geminocystis sp. NIES-3709]
MLLRIIFLVIEYGKPLMLGVSVSLLLVKFNKIIFFGT